MASGLRAPAEYGFGLTIDESTYTIRMFGRSEDELRAKLEADYGRQAPRYHRCLDEERPAVRIEWGQVKEWSISTPPKPLRRWGADLTQADDQATLTAGRPAVVEGGEAGMPAEVPTGTTAR